MNPVAISFIVSGVISTLIIIFMIVHSLRHVIWSGYMRVVFAGEDRRISGALIRIDDSDHDFEINQFGKVHKYGIDRDRIYRAGRFRLPTAYYKFGEAEPLDMLRTGLESKVSSLDYAQVARNTVTRDLLQAFDTKFLSAQNIFMMTILIMAGGLLLLGVFVNQKFDQMAKYHGIGVETVAPTPPPNPLDRN